ncbi:MAG: tRNA (adenosine(37)-N6)-threonylcarbamoyltransferase complex ATPase subunit type 1 TsaE [Eubacteriales bacterium]
MEYITNSPRETEELGKALAQKLKSGDFVAMYGDLGVGKTAFVRGVASVLCPGIRVQSPTYTIVNAYRGNIPLYHFDMYRIDGEEALYSCGFFDYLDAGGICIAEWCENITDFIPDNAVKVSISKLSDSPDARRISIE